MTDRDETINLVLAAKNLAGQALSSVTTGITDVALKAEGGARRIGRAFENVTGSIQQGIGSVVENLLSGGDLGQQMLTLGAFMAGQLAEGLIATAGEKLAESTVVEALGSTLAAAGAALGGLLDSAIALGMAALPLVLLAALVGAIVFLVNNPKVVDKLLEVGGTIVRTVVGAVAGLGKLILETIANGITFVATVLAPFLLSVVGFFMSLPSRIGLLGLNIVRTIVTGMASLPGKVADIVREAFAELRIDVGPFHITGRGITIDLPRIDTGRMTGDAANRLIGGSNAQTGRTRASGGWVGLHGPEWFYGGERGPELITDASSSSGAPRAAGGVTIEGVTEAQILDMVDRGMYFRLRRAAPTEVTG